MGVAQSRPLDCDEDESLGIAEMFTHAQSVRGFPLMVRIALFFPWTRRFVVKRLPTRTRHAGLDSIDSMGEMRAVLSAMGGWGEDENLTAQGQRASYRRLRASMRREQRRQGEWGRRARMPVRRLSVPPPSIDSGVDSKHGTEYETAFSHEYDRDRNPQEMGGDAGPSPVVTLFPVREATICNNGNVAIRQHNPTDSSDLSYALDWLGGNKHGHAQGAAVREAQILTPLRRDTPDSYAADMSGHEEELPARLLWGRPRVRGSEGEREVRESARERGHHVRESARDHIREQIHEAAVRWRGHSAHRIQRRYSAVV